ncbi:MAG: hypothetical protein ACKVQB_08085 [Bacteroidia bacterium]
MLKPRLLCFLSFLIFSSCENFYDNQPSYKIKVGETFKIYIGQNSCCSNIWINEKSINVVKYIDSKIIDNPLNKDCEGCTVRYAWIFKGMKPGTDTIKILNVDNGSYGEDTSIAFLSKFGRTETFIVTVTD